MALAIERVLRQFWLPGIGNVMGKTQRGLQAYLLDDRYRIFSLPTPSVFEITPFDAEEIKRAICHDLSRMACAAFESFYALSPPDGLEKSCGWAAIRAYYGAFFAAHSIIRIFGRTCSQLDASHLQFVTRVGSFTHGLDVIHSAGIYYGKWDERNSTLRFFKPTGNVVGGSHEVTWKLFLETLGELRNSLLSPGAVGLAADLQQAALDLDSFRAGLCEGGLNNGSWLSSIRNKVNYRHDFDAWFPYGRPANHYDAIWNAAGTRWLTPPIPIRNIPIRGRELERVMELSGAIVALCRCLIEHIGETSSGRRSFVKYGPESLIAIARKQI
jgi:hypothetical protein